MDNRFNFTQLQIRSTPIPSPTNNGQPTRKTYYDQEQPKLNVRVASSGSKIFYVIKKDATGKTKFVRIGSFPETSVSDAREKATEILNAINNGIDPTEEKRKQKARSQSLQQLIDRYIEDHDDLKPRTKKDYQQKTQWGFSDWLSLPACQITDVMILERFKKLTPRGKTSTNDAFVRLRAILNHARVVKAIDHNPVTILSNARLWHKRVHRTKMIQSHQLAEWLDAVDTITPEIHRTAFLLMLYMGYRIDETYSLEWAEVDLANYLIIQRDTKNGTDHELPIPRVLIREISQLQAMTGHSKYLFPAKQRDSYHGYPKVQIKQINDAVSFHFHPNMTRHTFTTIAEAISIPKTMIDRLTNHTMTNDVTGGYIHTEMETLREAINKIAAYIQAKTNQSHNVVNLFS